MATIFDNGALEVGQIDQFFITLVLDQIRVFTNKNRKISSMNSIKLVSLHKMFYL